MGSNLRNTQQGERWKVMTMKTGPNDTRRSDVKAQARPGYHGLGPAFKSLGLRKG